MLVERMQPARGIDDLHGERVFAAPDPTDLAPVLRSDGHHRWWRRPTPASARCGSGGPPEALDIGDELPDLLVAVILVGRHLAAADAIADGLKDLRVLVAVQEDGAGECGRAIPPSAGTVTGLAGSIEKLLSRGNRRRIAGKRALARLGRLRDQRGGRNRRRDDNDEEPSHDHLRAAVFSYHFRFAVALPMQTISGRLSAFRSATVQPAPAMPSSRTLLSQVFARGSLRRYR